MKSWGIALLLFAFAVTLRLWNLNAMGRWSDEAALTHKGWTMIELLKGGDFENPFWYNQAAGHPLLSSYGYGLASYNDFVAYDKNKSTDESYFSAWRGTALFRYDLTYTRLVSVIVSSLSIVLVFFIGARYFSLFTGVVAGIVLAMLPHFLAYSQLVTYESWVVPFFTASAFSYFLYLEKKSVFLLILTGILTGLTVEVKESMGIILVLYLGTFLIWRRKAGEKCVSFWHLLTICAVGLVTYIAVWPGLLWHLPEYTRFVSQLWFTGGLVPELIFGKQMGARSFYYPLAFLVTTPLVILLLTAVGLKVSLVKKKSWLYIALIWWFFVPFTMMFFHHRQNMVRYIIEIYAPVALLSALGLEYIVKRFTRNAFMTYSTIIPLVAYLFFLSCGD